MSKVLSYDAVILAESQQQSGESLIYIHITKEHVDYLKMLLCFDFLL